MSGQLNPRDIVVAGLTAQQVVQYARARQFEFSSDQGRPSPPGHFGPLAAELAEIDPQLVVESAGELGVDVGVVAGLAWAAAAIAGDQIATLATRVAELERQLAELL